VQPPAVALKIANKQSAKQQQRKRGSAAKSASASSADPARRSVKARRERSLAGKLVSLERAEEMRGNALSDGDGDSSGGDLSDLLSSESASEGASEDDEDNDYARNWEDEEAVDAAMENGGSDNDATFE
jgi:hypothetical protein